MFSLTEGGFCPKSHSSFPEYRSAVLLSLQKRCPKSMMLPPPCCTAGLVLLGCNSTPLNMACGILVSPDHMTFSLIFLSICSSHCNQQDLLWFSVFSLRTKITFFRVQVFLPFTLRMKTGCSFPGRLAELLYEYLPSMLVFSRPYMVAQPPHQAAPVHMQPIGGGPPDIRGPPMDIRGLPMGEPRTMMVDPRGPPMMEPRGPPMENRGGWNVKDLLSSVNE